MADVVERRGNCLCGAITIVARNAGTSVGACHCDMCRRWGGGPFMEIDCGSDVLVEGGTLAIFDSSPWAERGFCSKCGSHLFYRLKETGEHMVPVGIFDNDEGVVFDHQVFVDKKPSFYDFDNDTHDMTEAEVLAKYGAAESSPD